MLALREKDCLIQANTTPGYRRKIDVSEIFPEVSLRAVIQRVHSAIIKRGENIIASSGKGLLVFLGIEKGDNQQDADYMLDKILNLRIFDDRAGKMNRSLVDNDYEMMIVSQFTILGDCRKGRRPSFFFAEDAIAAELLYNYFILKGLGKTKRIVTGEFQTMMNISLVNDGPVTILLDSKKLF